MTNLNQKNIETSALDASFYEKLDQAIQLYKEGLAGNATAVKEANRLLEQLRSDYAADPLADAYHGSTMILIARDKTKPLDKLKWSRNGLMLLDKAVADAPQNTSIRKLRGKAANKLPEKYFSRTQTVIEDYTFLIDHEINEEGSLDPEEYSQLIYELGEAYSRLGRNQDAAMCWRKLESQTQDPAMQQLISQNLQALEGKPPIEVLNTDNLSAVLIGASNAVGNALQSWLKKVKKKEARRLRHKEKSRR